jgi:hypothetical protein
MVAAVREVGDQVGAVKEVVGQGVVGWVVEVVMVVVGQAVEETVEVVRVEGVGQEVEVKVVVVREVVVRVVAAVRAEGGQEEGKGAVGAQGKTHPGLCLLLR